MRKCPLLSKFNYPYGISGDNVGDWFKGLCEHCPLTDACVEEYSGAIPKIIKQKLKNAIVPCPHCDAKDKWWIIAEDNLHCVHCGERIYYRQVLKKTRVK